MAILGIVSLVVIAIALSPSPGDVLHPAQSMATSGHAAAQSDPTADPIFTSLAVVPAEVAVNKSQTFTVEVWINNVTDMAGWQIELVWNREIINCVEAQVNTPSEWGGTAFDWFNKTAADVDPKAVNTAWQFGSGIDNNYNATCGEYFKAECMGPRGSGYNNPINGSLAIVTLTFQALQAGSTSLYFSKDDYNSVGGYYEGMTVANSNANPIAIIDQTGFVEVQDQ
jgi:hypothetical protein